MSISSLLMKSNLKAYVKLLNNTMLKDLYFKSIKKFPKTHMDNILIGLCLDEMKKRGIVNG